jgi:hypothetical protein
VRTYESGGGGDGRRVGMALEVRIRQRDLDFVSECVVPIALDDVSRHRHEPVELGHGLPGVKQDELSWRGWLENVLKENGITILDQRQLRRLGVV